MKNSIIKAAYLLWMAMLGSVASPAHADYVQLLERVHLGTAENDVTQYHRERFLTVDDPQNAALYIGGPEVLCVQAPCIDFPGPSSAVSVQNRFGRGRAGGYWKPGELHAYAYAETYQQTPRVEAISYVHDTKKMQVNAPGRNAGDRGVFNLGVVIHASETPDAERLDQGLAGEAMWSMSVNSTTGANAFIFERISPTLQGPRHEFTFTGATRLGCDILACLPGYVHFSVLIPFVFGETFDLLTGLSASCSQNSFVNPRMYCRSNLYGSAYWGGISQVTDEAGRVIDDYSVNSDAGIDWRRSFAPQVVQEPAIAALLLFWIPLLFRRPQQRKA